MRSRVGTTLELDGLRAIAAWLVFLIHYISLARQFLVDPKWTAASAAVAQVGYLGVELFFVLSGYLVYGIIADGHITATRFISRRLTKILPTFWLILSIYVIAGLFFPELAKISLPNDWRILIANIFLLPGVYSITAIITVSWSLSYEIHFYLALLLVHRLGIVRITTRVQRIAGLMLIALLVAYGAPKLGMNSLAQFSLFVPGMIAWEIVAARINAPTPTMPVALIAFFCMMAGLVCRSMADPAIILQATGVPTTGAVLSLLLIGLPASVVIFRTALGDKSARLILANRAVVAGGRVSYSFYLTHPIVLHFLAAGVKFFGLVQTNVVVVVLGFIPALLIAHFAARFVFEHVEDPAMRLKFGRRVATPVQ